jgi:hypothetical protein
VNCRKTLPWALIRKTNRLQVSQLACRRFFIVFMKTLVWRGIHEEGNYVHCRTLRKNALLGLFHAARLSRTIGAMCAVIDF